MVIRPKTFFFYDAIIVSSITILTLSFSILTTTKSFAANEIIDDVSLIIPTACSIYTEIEVHPVSEINNGTYLENIGKTIANIECNDTSGFSLYAVGYTGLSETGEDHTKLVGVNSHQTINTGTSDGSTPGDPSNWAMKVSISEYNLDYGLQITNGYDNYSVVPDTYTKVATFPSQASSTSYSSGAAIETSYAAFMSSYQYADTYAGKVKYTLVHPASGLPSQSYDTPGGYIGYYPNAPGVADSMSDQSIGSSDTSATLWASNFQRTGYGFAGWSDAFDFDIYNWYSPSNPDAHIYGPNETIEFEAGEYDEEGLSLYAVWVRSEGSMQEWNRCNYLYDITALTDLRDGNTYAVAKLADGNCWMIENLRLDYDANISAANTQSDDGAFGGVFSGLAEPETANFSDSTTPNTLYTADTSSTTLNIITGSNQGYRFPRYRNDNTNNPVANMSGSNQNVYSYGNYYTWAAAIADTGFYNTNNQSVTTTSLCPFGWHLPTGGQAYASGDLGGVNVTGDTSTFREFYYLSYAIMGNNTTAYEDTPNNGNSYYSSNTINPDGDTATEAFRKFPNNFLYSGYALDSSINNMGGNGYYWSSTVRGNGNSYYLSPNGSNVLPGTYGSNKYYGFSIRCIFGEK